VWSVILNASLPAALALESGNIIGSSGIIGDPTWGDHTIIDTQNGSIIDWNSFNTSGGQSVRFRQYDGANLSDISAVLNRIHSGTVPTQFDGALSANGRVFVVNPAGIIFGTGSTVNVSQLVASGLNMSNDAFGTALADQGNAMIFAGGSGVVVNNGTINAGNSVYLVGQDVTNTGTILCPGGLVVMAAGETLQLGQLASNVVVDVGTDLVAGNNDSVINSGVVGEPGSHVGKLVLAAGDVFSQAIANVADVATIARDELELGDVTATGAVEAYSGQQANTSSSLTVNGDITAGSIALDDDVSAGETGDIMLHSDTVLATGKTLASGAGTEPDADGVTDTGSNFIDDAADLLISNLQKLWQQGAKIRGQNERRPVEAPIDHAALLASAVPLPDEPVLEISGCAALTQWAAKELGTGGGATQISIANSPASAVSMPPCDACAALKRTAMILRDYAGTHIGALSGVISDFASSDAPLSEEQDTEIIVAIADGAEGNADYALAKEYLDALAEYVGILNRGMDFSATESTQFVMDKYIAPLAEGENVALVTFLAKRLTTPAGS
jgi:filamentous hemagglutinin family protein